MTLFRNILIGFVGLITLVIAGIYLSGNGMLLKFFLGSQRGWTRFALRRAISCGASRLYKHR